MSFIRIVDEFPIFGINEMFVSKFIVIIDFYRLKLYKWCDFTNNIVLNDR